MFLNMTLALHACANASFCSYETSDGTANAGEDYVAKSGTIEFEEGEYIKTVEIDIIDDDVWEETETFFVRWVMKSFGLYRMLEI